jgi:dipeptidyl aminopeptidase/acylaminoacyl peptidase
MKKYVQRLAAFLVMIVALAACAAPFGTEDTGSSDQVATAAAMTLQALAPETASVSVPLLPRRLYFLGNDNQSISQVYRLERDGRTKTQLTFEPASVEDYDISPADGSIVYVMNNQLLWVNADGSNRRVFAEQGTQPVFSLDGKRLAFAHGGLNIYDLSTSANTLLIPDHPNDGSMPPETYTPETFSPDGTKLLVSIGHPPDSPSTAAIYTLTTQVLAQFAGTNQALTCCNFYGGAEWTADSSSFYSVASQVDSSYKFGELWRVDTTSASVTTMLSMGDGTINLPEEPYLGPDGLLYFFLGSYGVDSGFFDAPVLEMVRASPNGVTGRAVLRSENFVLMKEALWAPDASFVIVATEPTKNWDRDGGVLELYPSNGQKNRVWLAPFGKQMKWGP